MWKHLYIFLSILFICTTLSAKKIEGVIYTESDTLNVTLRIPLHLSRRVNYQKLQEKVKYFDAKGVKQSLTAEQAKEVRFEHEGKEVRVLSRRNTLEIGSEYFGQEHVFLKLEVDGDLRLFKFFREQTLGWIWCSGTSWTIHYAFQEGDGELIEAIGKKRLMQTFESCPALVNKMEEKEIRVSNPYKIAKFYNTSCN